MRSLFRSARLGYYKDDDSIYTITTLGDGSSSSYYSLFSNNRSYCITTSQVADTTYNDSVAIGITLESFQTVTSEMTKTPVYLRQIVEHLSLAEDGSPKGINLVNKACVSSKTTRYLT